MSFIVKIHFTSGDKVYAVLSDGFKLDDQVGAKGRHVTQSCSLRIRSAEASALFLQETALFVTAELCERSGSTDTVLFSGVVRPYQSVSARNRTEENFNLEIMDFTELMKTCSFEAENFMDKTLGWVVSHIYGLADLPLSLSYPAEMDDISLAYPILDSDKYGNVADLFSALLYEFGYDYKFEATRCVVFRTWLEDSSDLPSASVRNTLKVQREDNWTDGVRVKYGVAGICRQIPIAHHQEDISDLQWWRYALPWSYSDSSGHVTRTVPYDLSLWRDKPKELKTEHILYAMNPRVPYDSYCTVIGIVPKARSMEVEFFWDSRVDYVWGNVIGGQMPDITVYGDIVYAIPGDYEEQIEGEKPDEFTLFFVHDTELAQDFAKREYKRAKVAPITYSFQSLTHYAAGSFVRVTDNVIGIDVSARILSCSRDANGIYSVKAESADYLGMSVTVEDLRLRDVAEIGNDLHLEASVSSLVEGESVTVKASGSILDILESEGSEGYSFVWHLNGMDMPAWAGTTSVSAQASDLEAGENVFTFKIYYGTNLVNSAQVAVIKTVGTAVMETKEQYYISSSPTELLDGQWSDTLVAFTSGYLWRRLKYSYSNGTTVYGEPFCVLESQDTLISVELQYGLSTSPASYILPDVPMGYSGGAFGAIENDEDFEYGFKDVADWSSDVNGWYKGLYVWQRIKTTDVQGNVIYSEPTYCEEITQSLINGCILEVVLTDMDGDGNTHTWEKNLASAAGTVSVQFRLIARSYGSITAFETALQDVTVTPYKGQAALDPITLPAPSSKTFNADTKAIMFVYDITFAKKMDYDSLVINASISDTYLRPDGTSWTTETDASEAMTAVNVTVYDPFGGLFPEGKDAVQTIDEADSLAAAHFLEEYGGTIDGATYALNISGEQFLALRTHIPSGWVFLSDAGFDNPRLSAICSKAQKAVLSKVEAGTVTASDYGYFNVLIANVVTASFIGSKQIQLQQDEEGNPGMIYGGDVDLTRPQGEKTTGRGFYFDSDGNGEVSDFRIKGQSVVEGNTIVKGKISNTNEDDGQVVFETFKDSAAGYEMQAVSKVDGATDPDAFLNAEWRDKIAGFCSNLTAGTLYSASGTITTKGQRPVRKTLSGVKRLDSVNTNVQTLVDRSSGPDSSTAREFVAWENTLGKRITLEKVTISPQYSMNMFSGRDYGDTRVIVYNSDGTVYLDYGVNDDSGNTYTSVIVPKGGYIWCYWDRATKYSYSRQPGNIKITYKESDNWEVGVNLCFTDGNGKLLDDALYSTGFGTEMQEFTCNGTSYIITMSAAAAWPTGVYKYYGNFAWLISPQDSQGNPPTGTITASLLNSGSFIYAGQNKAIVSITFSATSLSIIAGDGNTYNLSSGYNRSYSFSAETLAEILGARSRSILPVYVNGQRIGGGYVGTNTEPWYQGWAQSWQQTSKREYKEDIEDYLEDAIALLSGVRVVKFHYKSDKDNPDRYWHYGFIADDTDEALATPQHNTMELGNCIGLLIKGIQELAARIDGRKK